MDIAELIVLTLEHKASDLHLTVGLPPSVRVQGEIESLQLPPLTRETAHDLIYSLLSDTPRARFDEPRDLDFSLDFGETGRFRVNAFVGRQGVGAVLRVIPSRILTVDELGLPPIISKLAEFERG